MNIEQILRELTLEEKACLLSGHKSWHTNKISRVGLPSIFLTDGPHGLRKKKEDKKKPDNLTRLNNWQWKWNVYWMALPLWKHTRR